MSSKGKRNRLIRDTRATLVERFPECFCPKGALKKPLKIGITRDLHKRCPDLSIDDVNRAVADYCGGASYQVALLALGNARFDLDGKPYGVISNFHARCAEAVVQRLPRDVALRWLNAAGIAPETILKSEDPPSRETERVLVEAP